MQVVKRELFVAAQETVELLVLWGGMEVAPIEVFGVERRASALPLGAVLLAALAEALRPLGADRQERRGRHVLGANLFGG